MGYLIRGRKISISRQPSSLCPVGTLATGCWLSTNHRHSDCPRSQSAWARNAHKGSLSSARAPAWCAAYIGSGDRRHGARSTSGGCTRRPIDENIRFCSARHLYLPSACDGDVRCGQRIVRGARTSKIHIHIAAATQENHYGLTK